MSDALEKNTRDKLYIWLSGQTNEKNLVGGNNIFISQRVGDRYGLLIEKWRWTEYDILDEMEWKNGKICDDSDSSCGEEHEIYDEN